MMKVRNHQIGEIHNKLLHVLMQAVFFCLIVSFSSHNLANDAVQKPVADTTTGKVLRIAGWDVYADPVNKNKTIGYETFEAEYGVTIQFTPLVNLDDIIEAAESKDKYDVFIISNEGIQILKKMNLVEPLNLDMLSHFQALYPNLRDNEWIRFDSGIYAAPWAWGPTGLLYDADVVPRPDSWNVLWDPDYKGMVSLWDDVSMIWITALSLGYNNVYNLTRDQLSDVKNKLFELNTQAQAYYGGGDEAIEAIRNGETILINSWFDPSRRLQREGRNFEFIIPREGAVGMFDSYLVSNLSSSKGLAHKYIDHQIQPDVQARMSYITGLAPANAKVEHVVSGQGEATPLYHHIAKYDDMLLWDVMPRKHLYDTVLNEVRQDLSNKLNTAGGLELNDAEKKWLEENPEITFTGDPNWLPYEAFNDKGEYIGIVAEHLKLISKKTGIKVNFSPSNTWTESVEKAKSGEVDVLSETDDSDLKSHLNFSKPYITNPIVIAMSAKQNYVEGINAISDMRIALIRDYGYAAKIRKKYSGIEFVTVEDIQDGLVSVSTGKVDALLCTLALCSYTISELGLNDVRITGKTEFDTSLAFGVQKNLPLLKSILDKTIARISREQQQVILDRWIEAKFTEKVDYSLAYKILFGACVLFVIFIFWNRRLSREIELRKVAEKTLQDNRDNLEELVRQRTTELSAARDEAERANAAKTQFLSRMSHELRTPMNAILGFSQLLELNVEKNLNENDINSLGEILNAGNHLLALIDEVLDLSRVELGKLKIEREDFDFVQLVNETLTMVRGLASKFEVTIVFPQTEESYMINADRRRTKQVVLNLLTNALKYNRKHGMVELSIEQQADSLVFSVEDTGQGIKPDLQKRVFDPFDRLDAHSTTIEGTGIGLSLCREIIELMGGRINFESVVDQGSIFWIELQLANSEKEPTI